jgi:hypothetical protein
VTSLVMVPIIVKEGLEAIRGDRCEDASHNGRIM